MEEESQGKTGSWGRSAKEAAFKVGKAQGISCRDLFTFNPVLVNQNKDYDDDDYDHDILDLSGYKQEEEQGEELKLNKFFMNNQMKQIKKILLKILMREVIVVIPANNKQKTWWQFLSLKKVRKFRS